MIRKLKYKYSELGKRVDNIESKIKEDASKNIKYPFFIAIALLLGVYIFYLYILMYSLKGIMFLNFEHDTIKLIGFCIIVITPILILITLGIYLKKKRLLSELNQYEPYVKWWIDIFAVCALIWLFYNNYKYEVPDIMYVIFSNDGILGLPYILFVVRCGFGFYNLKKR